MRKPMSHFLQGAYYNILFHYLRIKKLESYHHEKPFAHKSQPQSKRVMDFHTYSVGFKFEETEKYYT